VLLRAVALSQVVLAIHIIAVVVAFGVTFAYPLFAAVGERIDPRAMPWFHRMQHVITQRLISPGLVVVVVAGIYLASKLHQWSAFYVQWGLAVAVVLGGLSGAFIGPNESKLAELAERDLEAAGGRAVEWSQEYRSLRARVAVVGGTMSLLVVVTIYLMSVQAGA
jgi:hypothetical protein